MDNTIINEKLENLRNCIGRIESKKPFSLTELQTNFDLQDIISINVERCIQICIDIATHVLTEKGLSTPTTMAESFRSLGAAKLIPLELSESLAKAVGLRNVMVHTYSEVNWKVVHEVVHVHLNILVEFAKQVDKLKFT